MPRNNPQLIQSEKVSARATAITPPPKCHGVPLPAAKQSVSRLPRPTVVRIQARYIGGENQTQIAKAEGCDRETVSRIVKSSEMTSFVEEMKERFRGLAPLALDAIEYALTVERDASTAFEVLRNVGVAPRKGEPEQLPTTPETEESRLERQNLFIASVISERHRVFGIELPPSIQKAIDDADAAHPGETKNKD